MNIGLALAFAAAILWGASYTLSSRILKDIEPIAMLPIASLFRLAWFSALFFLFRWNAPPQVSAKSIGLIGAETVLSTAATFCIMLAISKIGASRASLIEISYPLFVVAFSAFFLNFQITLNMIIGGVMILLGVAILSGENHV